jgi:membrane protease YdiL (CAAX protease family)
MRNILKKTGGILFCLLPFIAGVGLQYIVNIICMFIQAAVMFLSPSGFHVQGFLDQLMTSTFNGFVMLFYGIASAVLMGVWYYVSSGSRRMPKTGIKQIFNSKLLIGIILLIPALQFIISYLIIIISMLMPSWYTAYNDLMENAGMNDITIVLLVYSVIAAPICEELIFRGVTLYYAKKVLPFWAANILQALLFGVYHMNLIQGIYAFIIGLFCGYIFHTGKSIYCSILYHMLFNIWGTMLSNLFYSGDSLIIHVLQLSGAFIMLGAGLFIYQRGGRSGNKIQAQ